MKATIINSLLVCSFLISFFVVAFAITSPIIWYAGYHKTAVGLVIGAVIIISNSDRYLDFADKVMKKFAPKK